VRKKEKGKRKKEKGKRKKEKGKRKIYVRNFSCQMFFQIKLVRHQDLISSIKNRESSIQFQVADME